jgi:hypothetical protein
MKEINDQETDELPDRARQSILIISPYFSYTLWATCYLHFARPNNQSTPRVTNLIRAQVPYQGCR